MVKIPRDEKPCQKLIWLTVNKLIALEWAQHPSTISVLDLTSWHQTFRWTILSTWADLHKLTLIKCNKRIQVWMLTWNTWNHKLIREVLTPVLMDQCVNHRLKFKSQLINLIKQLLSSKSPMNRPHSQLNRQKSAHLHYILLLKDRIFQKRICWSVTELTTNPIAIDSK